MSICKEASVGKILIQRDEATALSKLFYTKLPDLSGKFVILLDPMLATGGSGVMAIDECIRKGAIIENMIFVNIVSTPEGVAYIHSLYPNLLIITGELDEGLNEKVRYFSFEITNNQTNKFNL
jgi:uracil phosphoribosyltransferase